MLQALKTLLKTHAMAITSHNAVQIIGKTAGFAIPVLVVLLILVGFFAASSYDGGATSVMRP